MKKRTKEDWQRVLGALNPFAFRTSCGSLCLYSNILEAYQICVQMLWAEFPRGFVDLPYFAYKYQGLSLGDAEELTGRKQYAFVRIWDSDSEQRKSKLREILSVLLKVSGVSLNESYFLAALQNLDLLLEKQGISARTESGAVVQFTNKVQ